MILISGNMDDPLIQTVQRFVIVPVTALTGSEHKIGTSNSHSSCLSQDVDRLAPCEGWTNFTHRAWVADGE